MSGSSLSPYHIFEGSGPLYEIDPNTGVVIDQDEIDVGSGEYDGLAVLDNEVYLVDLALDDIHVLETGSDTVTRTLDIDGVNPGVSVGQGLAAITSPDALLMSGREAGTEKVFEIDPATGAVIDSFPAEAAAGLATVQGKIFLAGIERREMTVFDRQGRTLTTFSLPYDVSALGGDDAGH